MGDFFIGEDSEVDSEADMVVMVAMAEVSAMAEVLVMVTEVDGDGKWFSNRNCIPSD